MSRTEKFSYETSGNRQPVRADIVLDATERLEALTRERARREQAEAAPARARRVSPPQKNKQAEEKTGEKAETMAKKKKKKKSFKILPVLAAVLIVALLAVGLVGFGIIPVRMAGSGNTYAISDAQTLVKYLTHPSMKAGDTVVVSGNLEVDVDELFGGFADIPLVNYDCSAGGVTFTGGAALLTGGEAKTTMNGVKFVDCDVYMEAPSTAVTWVDCTDDSHINAKSLNGASHKQDLGVKIVGARFEVPVTFTNKSASALSNVNVTLASTNFVFPDGESYKIKSLGAGESVTETIEVVAVYGGRGRVLAYAADSSGALAVTGASDYVSVMGTGLYAGDVHTHTEATGRDATLEGNVRAGYANGMSFIVSSERNAAAQVLSQSEVDGIVGESNAFLQLGGYELCEDSEPFADLPSFKSYTESMDFLILGADVVPNNHYIVPDTSDLNQNSELTPWMLQDAIDEVDRAGGLSVLTHFFDINIETKIGMAKSFTDLDGIEVMTPYHTMDSTETRVAMNVWKLYGTFGAEKTFALAASNNETSAEVGSYFIKGAMSGLTDASAYKMIESGNYFFSNSPELSFTIGGASMGSDFTTSEQATTTATMFACDDVPLTKVVLTRYHVTHSKNDIESEEMFSYDLTGKGVCSFSDSLEVTVSPNEFYVFEAYSESDNLGKDVGFASSNPIYSVAGSDAEQKLSGNAVESMKYLLGGSAQQAGNGAWYLTSRSYLPFLMDVSSAGNRVSVVYHKLGTDAACDYLTVLVTADDGTQSSQRVYLINA
ncbi:MAG: hypothetical protein VB092_09895 [Oscillospiraceae bacterium]|nr:hypothetical protein [Oscillospiraceae bacterium]